MVVGIGIGQNEDLPAKSNENETYRKNVSPNFAAIDR